MQVMISRLFSWSKNSIQLRNSLGGTSFTYALAAHYLTTIHKFCASYINMKNSASSKPKTKCMREWTDFICSSWLSSPLSHISSNHRLSLITQRQLPSLVIRMDTALQNLLQRLEHGVLNYYKGGSSCTTTIWWIIIYPYFLHFLI